MTLMRQTAHRRCKAILVSATPDKLCGIEVDQ